MKSARESVESILWMQEWKKQKIIFFIKRRNKFYNFLLVRIFHCKRSIEGSKNMCPQRAAAINKNLALPNTQQYTNEDIHFHDLMFEYINRIHRTGTKSHINNCLIAFLVCQIFLTIFALYFSLRCIITSE